MRCFKSEHLISKKRLKVPWSGKLISAFLALAIMCGMPGCSVSNENAPEVSLTEDSEYQSGFDIERVRKSIIVKGQTFEIPVVLNDLKDGWTWEEDTKLTSWADKGDGVIFIYYNGEKMLNAVVENFYDGNKEKGVVYSISISEEDKDISLDGLTPTVSTKQDVLDKYGEPTQVQKGFDKSYYDESYIYGILHEPKSTHVYAHAIEIKFADAGTIKGMCIIYSDLTKYD